jgi:hypothetical protein
MLLKVFRGTGPGVIFLIVISLAIFWISAFINPKLPVSAIYEIKPMPLYGIIKLLIGNNSLLGVIFSFLILSIMLFLVISFNTSVFFINERTFLPAFIYLLFSSLFPQYQVLNPVLPATLFLMLAVMRIMDSYRKPGIAFNFFDAAILISIASLFYANLIWFGLLVIISIILLRTVNTGEIALALLGLATPYIITLGLYYVLGKDLGIFLSDIRDNLFGETDGYWFKRLTIIVLIYSGLIVFISLGFLSTQMNSKKIKSRKTFYLLFWWFLISLVLYFILPSISVEMIWIISIPASYFLAHYFIFVKKKLLPEIIFTGFLLLILLIQIFYVF